MSFGRAIKRRAKAAVPPLVFLLLVGYFLWSATQGPRGLAANTQRNLDIVNARAELAQAARDLGAVERRVAALRGNRLDTDALDERARAMLSLSEPGDVIVPLKGLDRIF